MRHVGAKGAEGGRAAPPIAALQIADPAPGSAVVARGMILYLKVFEFFLHEI